MGSSALNIAIENKFKVAWGSTTTVRYDNVAFAEPTNASWVSIEVWDGDSIKGSLGSGVQLRRSNGTAFVHIYSPTGQGSKATRVLADSVATIFRDLQVSGITFFEATKKRLGEVYHPVTGGGNSGTAQWYEMIVAIPFIYDEFI